MPELLIVVLALGAAARITRLINSDMITQPLRDLVAHLFGKDSTALHFLECPWCVGFWVSAAITPMLFCPRIVSHPVFLIAITALTMSWLIGIAARNLDPR